MDYDVIADLGICGVPAYYSSGDLIPHPPPPAQTNSQICPLSLHLSYYLVFRRTATIMDSPPPPNNNHNNNNDRSNSLRAKEEALARGGRNNGVNENGDVEMFNLQDNGLVVVMFLMSVAGWMLRERCVC